MLVNEIYVDGSFGPRIEMDPIPNSCEKDLIYTVISVGMDPSDRRRYAIFKAAKKILDLDIDDGYWEIVSIPAVMRKIYALRNFVSIVMWERGDEIMIFLTVKKTKARKHR